MCLPVLSVVLGDLAVFAGARCIALVPCTTDAHTPRHLCELERLIAICIEPATEREMD
jgi:hypothetical protein